MRESRFRMRWRLVLIAGLALLISTGDFGLPMLADRLNQYLIESHRHYETTVTVTKKEYVRFDENNHSYITDLGHRIEVPPGTEHWRVYYEFDNFDQIAEPERSSLMQLEKERIANGRLRYWIKDKEWYDSIKTGDKLKVGYRPVRNSNIDIANVSKAHQ